MRATKFQGAPFQGMEETRRLTGLSRNNLYEGAKNGTYPAIKSGNRILFNVPALLEKLQCMSIRNKENTEK